MAASPEKAEDGNAGVAPATIQSKATDDGSFTYANKHDAEHHLPVAVNPKAKWYHAAYHNVTALVGAGVLGLPYAMGSLTWGGGIAALIVAWLVSLYTLHQLAWLHEFAGKRFCRYSDMGTFVLGKKWSNWIVLPPQVIVIVGLGITYTVTGGQSLHQFWGYVCEKSYDMPDIYPDGHCNTSMGLSAWIVVFGAINLVLIQVPDLHSLSIVSLLAAVTALSYCTIGFGGSVKAGKQPDAVYNLDHLSKAAGIFGVFSGLGTIAFSFGGHTVVLEVQSTLPSPPRTYKRYMTGIYVAYAVLSWCFFGVAFAGYHAFGRAVASNVIFSIEHPVWMVCFALLCIVVHVIGSYQVYTFAGLDLIELALVKRGISNGLVTRLIYRTIYVCLTTFVAVSLPFFGDLLAFVGSLGMGPITFWLPSVFWIVIYKPKMNDWNFWASWFSIVFGVLITIVGAIGGLRGIIVSASDKGGFGSQQTEKMEQVGNLRGLESFVTRPPQNAHKNECCSNLRV